MMKTRVLVVDDDRAVCQMLRTVLAEAGHEPSVALDADSLSRLPESPAPDVIILDWQLPDGDGIALLPQVKRRWPRSEVIILTGYGTFDAAVEATKLGAFHFIGKPVDIPALRLLIQRAAEHTQLVAQTQALHDALSTLGGVASPIFRSPAMQQVLRLVERVAPSDAAVLLSGESGTGKEVIADLIHALSRRSSGPLVKVNCAALPRELIESELFGAVKGAYTGAVSDRDGLFRQAGGGSLFLDEISEMPLDTQAKLLRVLQEKRVRPVGGRTAYATDCRIVAATNRPLPTLLEERKLREDLYYRVAAVRIDLPPLRERHEDIVPLAHAFLRRFASQAGRPVTGFSPAAIDCLCQHAWPGNVRELENEIQRAVLLCEGVVIEPTDLSVMAAGHPAAGAQGHAALTPLEAVERDTIARVLRENQGNKLAAAKRLGIGRQTLYNKIAQYDLGSDAPPRRGPEDK